MTSKEQLQQLCNQAIEEKGLSQDERYKKRLTLEFKEIDAQGEHDYLLNLHKEFKEKKLVFPKNEHNLLVVYLLGLSAEFDIEKEFAFVLGEMPDVDVDFIKDVRDYLKRTWAAEAFGQEQICEIGTYGTVGIKSAVLDCAKLHSVGRDEIQSITTKMLDKDDEGHELEWDKALEIYPEFKAYCERYPDVARDAFMMLDRNKSGGVHAGGLIIADRNLGGFVPLEVRSVTKDNPNGVICSAWTEGLNRQDLGPVGLIKFDLLVINNLMQIALACKLIKDRHGIELICGKTGSWNWSDISYLNDPKAIEMANKGDLKCIFQFDSEGIRKLVKKGGVTRFDDLVAYSSLYRPGPLGMGMDATYCKRKRGQEPFNIHPLMQKSLGVTYGVMAFQEQVMDILSVVGDIPDMHTEKVRKAISKKKVKDFIKYKEMFIDNGQKNLNVNAEYVLNLWEQIESFAEYGFNKSVLKYTKVPHVNGVKEIQNFVPGDIVYCVNEYGKTVETEVVALHDHGEIEGFEVTFDDGHKIVCSANHKFLTEKGQVSLRNICRTSSTVLCAQQYGEKNAENKERGLDCIVSNSLSKQNFISQSSEDLFEVQGIESSIGFRKIQTSGSMRPEGIDTNRLVQSSERLPKVSKFSVEELNRDLHSKMWSEIYNMERSRIALQNMRGMQGDQKEEHLGKNGEVECGQFISRQEKDNFRDSSGNIGTTRNSSISGREFEEMAGGQSRSISKMLGSSMEEPQTISNGIMGSPTIGLAYEKNSLWGDSETGRFCEWQYMDRSGWILPLFRTSEQFGESVSIAESASKRQDVERGMYKEGRCDVVAIEHGVFCEFNGSDEDGDMELGAGHASITDTRHLVHRKIVRVVSVGKCHMFDLEVSNPTHNFLLLNGVVTSNSHSCAYSYISARLLWLKAHYPLEFYTAILMCESDHEKLKDYKLDADNHGVKVNPIHINKSRANFNIEDGQIYFGFSNIKGIGEGVADRIVENQSYSSFQDFLNRFGTESTPIKALTALGVFEEEHDRLHLRKYAEYYKDVIKKRRDRQKRFENTMDKKLQELKEMLLEEVKETDSDFEKMCDFSEEANALWESRFAGITRQVVYKYKGEDRTRDVTFVKQLQDLAKKRESSIKNFYEKEKDADEGPLTLDQFNASNIALDPEEEKVLTNELEIDGKKSFPEAESLYYGFQWTHIIETCPNYTGATIDKFLDEAESNPLMRTGMIEVQIKQVQKRTSKGEKATVFYSVTVEDANAKQMKITIWSDDYTRFKDELKAGNLVKIRVRPPSGGFYTLTFDSVERHKRKFLPPKEDDHRLILMKAPEPKKPEKPEALLDELKFDPSAIIFQEPVESEETRLSKLAAQMDYAEACDLAELNGCDPPDPGSFGER